MSPPNSILAVPGDPPSSEISIAQISADGMALHWYESVAIVQQVCQTLGDLPAHPKFDWSKVFVDPSGEITIRSPGSSDADACVRALGELLRTWLAGNPHPVPLGLVVAQATSTPPFYRGAAELSEALSHYERPNRIELIRNVHERCRTASPAAHAPPEETSSTRFAVELSRKAGAIARSLKARTAAAIDFARAAVRKIPRRARRIAVAPDGASQWRFPWKWAAAMALAIMMAVIAGGLLSSGLGRPAATNAGNALGRANDRLVDGVAARLGAAVNWVGRRFVRMPSGQQTPSSAEPPVRNARRSTTRTSPGLPGSPPDGPGDVSPNVAANVPNDVAGTANQAVASPPAQNSVSAASPQPSLSIVYSSADRDVTPPVAIGRQLPDLPPTGVPQSGIALVIVVDQTGGVESATLATRPATLQDAMQATMNLSAAKSWRFRPALRAGQPVKYLRSVWLANR